MSGKSSKKRMVRKRAGEITGSGAEELDRQQRLGDGEPDAEAPELTESQLADAARRRLRRLGTEADATKERITIFLDRDILSVFRDMGPGYQTRINEALRLYLQDVAEQRPRQLTLRQIQRELRALQRQTRRLESRKDTRGR